MPSFYERYWSRGGGHLSDFQVKWPKLKKLIPTNEGITIVDFGCGAGEILKEIKALNPKARLVGLDVSEGAIARAKTLVPSAEFHVIRDGERLPLADGVAGFIFSSEVIEHIYDTDNAISEMARILKKEGSVLLTTPYHGFIKNIAIVVCAFDRHFDPAGPHVRFFSKKSLFGLLEKHALKVASHGYYGRFYPLSHSIFVVAKKV